MIELISTIMLQLIQLCTVFTLHPLYIDFDKDNIIEGVKSIIIAQLWHCLGSITYHLITLFNDTYHIILWLVVYPYVYISTDYNARTSLPDKVTKSNELEGPGSSSTTLVLNDH